MIAFLVEAINMEQAQQNQGRHSRNSWSRFRQKPWQRDGQRPQHDRPRLVGACVTIRWLDDSISGHWFRVHGVEANLILLEPVNQSGEAVVPDGPDTESFWTPTQAIVKMIPRLIYDPDLEAWLRQ